MFIDRFICYNAASGAPVAVLEEVAEAQLLSGQKKPLRGRLPRVLRLEDGRDVDDLGAGNYLIPSTGERLTDRQPA